MAQEQQKHEKGAHVDSLNRYYQQADLPLYLFVSHSPDAKPTQLSEFNSKKQVNPVEPIYLDGHGEHHLTHRDAVHGQAQQFTVYADGIAPKSSIQFTTAPHYVGNGRHYYGKDLSVTLSTVDEMSGVAALFHSVNGEEYQSYSPSMGFKQEGDFQYKYYSVDNVGNVETINTDIFTVDLTAPKTYYNVVGVNKDGIISTSTKIYLTFEDNISGVATTYYKLDDGDYKPYRAETNIPFQQLEDGDHTLTFYSVDNVKNEEVAQSFDFYLDKTAPIMSADVLGDKFVVGDQVYFSGRTKLKLTAVDNKAGIKEVYYAIDGKEFQKYEDPFYLPSIAGEHVVRYYALDEMENRGAGNSDYAYDEYRHNVSKVYVDLTGPVMSFEYLGEQFLKGDTIYITGDTKIKLAADDPESGLQYISYQIDKKDGEENYNAPFIIPESGTHEVEYFGYDNVNNRNVDRFVMVVDNTPPEVEARFSVQPDASQATGDGIPVYPSYTTIYLSSTDELTGAEDIRYSINGGPERVYSKPITGLKKGQTFKLKIMSSDKLGNEKEEVVEFKTTDY